MKRKGCSEGRHAAAFGQAAPPGARVRAGLDQRAGPGRTGLGQQRPAAKGRGECVVVNPRREFRRSDVELGWKIGCGGAAQAVAAARKCLAALMVGMR